MKDCCSFITKIFCCRIWFDLFQNFNQLVVFFFLCSIIEISFCIVCRIFPWDGIQRCRFVIISQKDGFSLNLFCCSVQQDYYLVNIFAYFFCLSCEAIEERGQVLFTVLFTFFKISKAISLLVFSFLLFTEWGYIEFIVQKRRQKGEVILKGARQKWEGKIW